MFYKLKKSGWLAVTMWTYSYLKCQWWKVAKYIYQSTVLVYSYEVFVLYMSIFFFCDFKPLLGSIYLIAFFLIHQSSSIHNIISKWIMIYRFWLKGNSTDFTCWKCYNYPQCNWVITGGNFFRLHAASCWDTKKSLAVFFPTYAVVLTSRLKWAPPFHVHVN